MSCRHGYTRMAMLLGLLAPLGCARWQVAGPQVTGPAPAPSPVAQTPPAAAQPVTALNPQQAALLCLAAGEALEKKGYTAEAIRQYENARTHDPQLKPVSRRLAVLYDMQGDAQRAEAEYQRALNEQPRDAELLNDLGYFHYRHDRIKNAEEWLRNAVNVDPNCACAWINLGQLLAKQGRFDESLQAFAHVLRPAEAHSNLGVLLAKQGRTEEARTAFQQALSLDPSLKQPKAFLSALSRPPALLPPGISRTPTPASLDVSSAPPPLEIVPSAPTRTDEMPAPAIVRTSSQVVPSALPTLPGSSNPPPFMSSAPPPSSARNPVPAAVEALRTAPEASIPLPVITHVPLPRQANPKTPPPAPMPGPLPPVFDLSPSVAGTPLRPAASPTLASPKPALLPPSIASAPPAELPAPSPVLSVPPAISTSAPPARSAVAKPTPPPQSEGPSLSTAPAADPETESRSPIVILTDCERAKDASPP